MPSALRSSEQSPNPARIASRGDFQRAGLPRTRSSPLRGIGAEDGTRDFGPAGAEQPRQTDDLAAADRDVGAIEAIPSQVFRLDQHLAGRMLARMLKSGCPGAAHLSDLLAQHARHELDLARPGDRALVDRLAIAHDRDPVADGVELVQPVADVDHRDPAGLEAADHVEQDLDFAFIERGRRFVHDDDARIGRDRPRDGHHLLQGDVERAERPSHVDMHAKPVQHGRGVAVHPLPIEQTPAPRLTTHEDVLGRAPIGNEVDLLVDRADPGELGLLGVVEVDRSPLQHDRPSVAPVGAVEDLDQRALAGPVLPDDGVHFARRDAQRRAVERDHTREGFFNAFHDQEWF